MGWNTIGVLSHIHGHLGWLAAAALVHPAVLLRKRERRARASVALSAALVTGAAAGGALVYPTYSERARQAIFLESPSVGWLFERKEHLAFGVIALAWAGAAAYGAARWAEGDARTSLRRIAWQAFAIAAVLAVVVAAIGTVVASYKGL